jgi:hypothetical protein
LLCCAPVDDARAMVRVKANGVLRIILVCGDANMSAREPVLLVLLFLPLLFLKALLFETSFFVETFLLQPLLLETVFLLTLLLLVALLFDALLVLPILGHFQAPATGGV